MRSNPASDLVIKPIAGLSPDLIARLRQSDVRREQRLFVAEGIRFLSAAIVGKTPIAGIFLCRERPFPSVLRRCLEGAGCPISVLSESAFAALTQSEDPPPSVLTVLHETWRPLPKYVRHNDLWLGLDNIRTPGNLGTLFRSAAAVGARGVMIFGPVRDRADPFDPACVRAAMGAISSLEIVETSHQEFRRWKHRYELTVLAASGDAILDYRTITYRRATMIMLGHERKGLSEAQRITSDVEVRIPMAAGIDSLNIAMAGTVLLYEAYNQRHPIKRR